MERTLRLALPIVLLVTLTAAHAAKQGPPQPTPEQTRALADAFAQTVADRRMLLADGALGWLVAPEGQEKDPHALMTRDRLHEAFQTITEAAAWPSTWLVVRDPARETDLLLTIEMEQQRVLDPQAAFEAPRKEWGSAKEIEAALLAVRGDRLQRRPKNVVLVEFSTKTVTTYVYEVKPKAAEDQGLSAMLPPGSLLRAARSVRLPDGTTRTLALVLQEATFHPSDCTTCEAAMFGHADAGRVVAMLAGDKAIVDQVDLTPMLRGVDGSALLPRFTCERGDEIPASAALPVKERFADRESVTLLDLKDLDQDGLALEFRLPARYLACGKAEYLEVAVDPKAAKLVVGNGDRHQ
jgi:hypothetical protein